MTDTSASPGPAPIRSPRSRRRSNASLGDVLGKTFSIWGTNLVPLGLMALMIYWPFGLLKYWVHAGIADRIRRSGDIESIGDIGFENPMVLMLVVIEASVMASLLMGTLTALVVARLQDRPLDLGEGVRQGLRALPRVIGVSLTIGLVMGVAIGVPFLFMLIHEAFVLLFLGSVIVMVMLWVRWFVAVPATVVEGLGIGASLSRSAKLVRSYGRSVFWMGLLMAIIGGLMQVPIMIAAMVMVHTPAHEYMAENVWVPFVSYVLITPLSATFPAVVYHALREAKDGPTTEQLADVFA